MIGERKWHNNGATVELIDLTPGPALGLLWAYHRSIPSHVWETAHDGAPLGPTAGWVVSWLDRPDFQRMAQSRVYFEDRK